MSTIILPKPTTANERLFGKPHIIPAASIVIRQLTNLGWIYDNGKLYQPLFGLTAKDMTGKVRTVVEGDVVLFIPTENTIWNKDDVGIVAYRDHAFVIDWGLSGGETTPIFGGGLSFTILCHCTEIVAAGNKIKCWECRGSGEKFGRPRMLQCPTCHGSGQHEIEWEGVGGGSQRK